MSVRPCTLTGALTAPSRSARPTRVVVFLLVHSDDDTGNLFYGSRATSRSLEEVSFNYFLTSPYRALTSVSFGIS